MKKNIILISLLFATLCVSSQNLTISDRLFVNKHIFSSISDWALYLQNFDKLYDLQKRMHDAVLKIGYNNEKAKDRAVFLSNNAGYTAILYKGNYFFIEDRNRNKIAQIVKIEFERLDENYSECQTEWEKEDDLVAEYKQKLKQDKAIDPVNGGHRHEIEKALDLHQARLKYWTEELEKAKQKHEEFSQLYKELEVIISKYYSVREQHEDNKGFACII